MVILVTGGEGLYQAEGQPPRLLRMGDVLEIPAGTGHWHGATKDSWFSQMVIYDNAWKDAETRKEDDTLSDEYWRDRNQNLPIELPVNYFPDDDPLRTPVVRWRSAGQLIYTNWLNYYVYQTTPYDLTELDKER